MVDSNAAAPSVIETVSLVLYRRRLLADAKKERAAMSRLVRRCEKSLRDAEHEMRNAMAHVGVANGSH